jgi:hypothetical protein
MQVIVVEELKGGAIEPMVPAEHWRLQAQAHSAAAEERACRELCTHFSWRKSLESTSPAELGSAAQPDDRVLPIVRPMPMSELLEALPGGEHAATPELDRAARADAIDERYRAAGR